MRGDPDTPQHVIVTEMPPVFSLTISLATTLRGAAVENVA